MITGKIAKNIVLSRGISSRNMFGSTGGVPLQQVVQALNNFANVSLAASWDNVGLLIEPSEPRNVNRVLLTNDLTEKVMHEAVHRQMDMIVSYHPPIFAPMKRLTTKTWKERIALQCIEHKIALYSPHTSFDSIVGGVNDWLAGAFDITTSKPIEPSTDNPNNGMGRFCTLRSPISDQEAVNLVKRRVNLSYVRLAQVHNPDKMINTVAVCAGSGASVLKNIRADLFVTGEMLHHDILDAIHNETAVILTNHSDSERGFLQEFAGILKSSLKNSVTVEIAKTDVDPLMTV